MRVTLVIMFICFFFSLSIRAQETDGVVALNLPVRNSLTFNRFALNPTFSFVREQSKYISLYNKREWVQFEDAPLTYMASYSGRFSENIGAGLSLFQQNLGVLRTFGGILNFAYNTRVSRMNNLTFGLNIGAYSSGINTSNVVTNFSDPSLNNVPSNFILNTSPGINYGTEFFDFGVSINNLVSYNLETSEMLENNPEQGIQAHVMYTGYMQSRGFFDNAKFSGLVRSEFRSEETIISALAMVTVPKGIWAQLGYNSVFGPSAGLGINLTAQIALEYNFETTVGDLNNFGPSHDITLAYRFQNNRNYDYSGDDDIAGLISSKPKRRRSRTTSASKKRKKSKSKPIDNTDKKASAIVALAKEDEINPSQKEQTEAKAQAKLLAEQKAKEEAEAQAKLLAEQKAKEEAEAHAKLLAEQKAKEEAEAQAKLLAEQKAKEEAEAQAKLLVEQKAKEEAEAQAKLLAEQKAKEEAEAQAKLLAEQKAKEEAEAQAKLLAEQKSKEEAEAQAKLLAEQKAKDEAEAKRLQEEQVKAKENLITNPQDEFGKAMLGIDTTVEASKIEQDRLLNEFNTIINVKDDDLKALKEENDLSEQGITVAPRPFKSVTAENNKLKAIKADLDKIINEQNDKIAELKSLYEEQTKIGDTLTNETVLLYYRKKIKRLEAEQLQAVQTRSQLESRLETIRVATEFEKRRRIVRAAYDNEEERYAQDRATLNNLRKTTALANTPYSESDFDFGEEQGNSIKILKNINNEENGFYLVLAVHSNSAKRDDFVKKVIASGRQDVDFFYDVSTSKYYIYTDKFDSLEEANEALNQKGSRPYNTKMSLMKIEN
ncbi:PorP/SprF family type IX secretion system membrane protein [Winogradskyella alexanderae]|uniref:PorP/SprF family type IX secretion system membrane protein n=1 Tax=Winogradskyella alexanderae TaxID=2877123 RepID=A0ABS7XTG5_9FLAO|nr:PorP/SprF family type IX secretion system membrane protein [Winogradskyella alexanderae]MCA0132728.1 PorP/SprF family type IX secretion system membrane protein [Winogradskyella alexanderae]